MLPSVMTRMPTTRARRSPENGAALRPALCRGRPVRARVGGGGGGWTPDERLLCYARHIMSIASWSWNGFLRRQRRKQSSIPCLAWRSTSRSLRQCGGSRTSTWLRRGSASGRRRSPPVPQPCRTRRSEEHPAGRAAMEDVLLPVRAILPSIACDQEICAKHPVRGHH